MIEEITIRPFVESDSPYIYSTWLKHYKYSSEFAMRIPAHTFYEMHKQIIERIINRKSTQIKIASLKEDKEIIVGYLVTETYKAPSPLLHWIYTKRTFRNMGIARHMLDTVDLSSSPFTHFTKDMSWLMKKYPGLNYNPYLL